MELLAHLAELGTPPDDGEAVLQVSAGLQGTLERVARETLPFIAAGGGDIQFVFGPYGRGKTHFLKALGERARRHGCVISYVDSQRPFESLVETYRAITASMVPPGAGELVATAGITKVIEARLGGLDAEARSEVIGRLKSDRALAPGFRNLALAYCTEVVADGAGEELGDRLQALLASTATYRVNLGPLYRQHPELPQPLGKLSRRNAAVWLRSALSLPQVLGYSGLIVLFDETEAALGGSRPRRTLNKKQQAHLAHIRTFVDHMATGAFRGCAIYYAVTEEFIDVAERHLGALSQRIERTRAPEVDGKANPRAVWTNIEELTDPDAHDPAFFKELGGHMMNIGRRAGLVRAEEGTVVERLEEMGARYVGSLTEGRVREFVKEAATMVAEHVAAR